MDEPASLAEGLDGSPSRLSSATVNQDVLVMTVEIGDGRQDVLYVKDHDDPSDLAEEFANKHNLDPGMKTLLTQLITQNKEMAKKKGVRALDPKPAPESRQSREIQDSFDLETYTPRVKPKPTSGGNRKGSVYERLYQRRKKPAQEPRSASVSSSRQSGSSSFNYGEWLYIRGMQSKESQKRSAQSKKQARLQTEEKELTFKPTINRHSSLLSPRYSTRTEDILLQKEAEKQERLEQMKFQAEADKLKECSFNPKINPRSQQLDTSRSSNKPRFVDLFQEANKRKERQLDRLEEAVKSEFPFKPEIHGPKVEVDHEAFIDRIHNSKKKFEEELEKIRKEMVTDVDPVTGQKFFEPQISHDARYQRNLDTSIHDYLYSHKDQKRQTVERLAQELDENIRAAQHSTKVTQNSERILENFRRKAYDRLFKLLDSDRDGRISVSACDIDALEPKTAQILEPLLAGLTDESVEFGEFQQLMDKLMSRLTLDAKSFILKREAKGDESGNSSLKSLPGDMYIRQVSEKQVNTRQQTKQKMEQIKKSLELKEMEECTFRPFVAKAKFRKDAE